MSKTLKHRNHTGIVEIDLEDNILHGRVLFILDLVTYESDSVAGLKREFIAAVDAYLDDK